MMGRNEVPDRRRAGMTLVEMMVAIAMFGVVMTVVFGFLTNSRRSYSHMSQRVEFQQSARAVLDLITGEIRSAGCDPLSAGFTRFVSAAATGLECRMDLDGDGAIEVTEPAEDVSYAYDAGRRELSRNNGAGAQVVLRNVTAVDFRYFDATGAEIAARPLTAANRARIRSVLVDITGVSNRDEPLRFTTRVNVRNG
jgi:prepilin-type N-terminal cleavage/methylation domain-containing protein